MPIYKKGKRDDPDNWSTVSLMWLPGKIMEWLELKEGKIRM